jgi:thioredoxin-like negative regulator of GroEL
LTLAQSATKEGDLPLADQCFAAAFAAEPTNAEILWDRAKLLERRGQIAQSRQLFKQLAEGQWQPRFEGTKRLAQQAAAGN